MLTYGEPSADIFRQLVRAACVSIQEQALYKMAHLPIWRFFIKHFENDQPSERGEACHLPGTCRSRIFSEKRLFNMRNTLCHLVPSQLDDVM